MHSVMMKLERDSFPGSGRLGLSGSIAERRAVTCGFNAARISTPRFRSAGPATLASPGGSGASSPCLTIPPGISPTALLDSPIMLPNSQAQMSPTTGTFSFPPFFDESPILSSADDKRSFQGNDLIFPITCNFPASEEVDQDCTASDQVGLLGNNHPMHFEIQPDLIDYEKNSPLISSSSEEEVYSAVDLKPSGIHRPVEKELVQEEDGGGGDGDLKGHYNNCLGIVKNSEDGYNWRKYGQKQVKGSEFPRSYYKCTYQDCQVKKKVERSQDGQITEIIYKGAHSHPKPQPPRRGSVGPAFSLIEYGPEAGEGGGAGMGNPIPIGLGMKDGNKPINGLEGTSPTSVMAKIPELLGPVPRGKDSVGLEPGPGHGPPTPENDDDGAMVLVGEEADDDEPDPKRRKPDQNGLVESGLASSRAVREPRVVIQIESEVDILEDGYRWRKYGQKVVKGNPNPRSYYKCTSSGCPVRKHVERACHDLKFVITTYEGKHNHEVPAARNGTGAGNGNPRGSIGAGALPHPPPPPPHPHAQSSSGLAIPKNPNIIPKPESQLPDLVNFDRKPKFGSEFLRSTSLLTSFGNYPMKFSPLRSCGPFGPGGPVGPGQIPQARPMVPVLPDFPASLPFKFNNPSAASNIPLTSVDYKNNGRAPGLGLGRALFPGQQIKEKDPRFLTPKQEMKEEQFYDPSFPIIEPNSSNSSMFPQALMGFPQ